MTAAEQLLLEQVRARRVLPAASERRRIREAAHCSQHEIAKALGVSWTAIYRWEQGSGRGSVTTRSATRNFSPSSSG